MLCSLQKATWGTRSGSQRGGGRLLAKPFSLDELLARIRVLLRRYGGRRSRPQSPGSRLDTSVARVQRSENGGMTPRVFYILEFFFTTRNESCPVQPGEMCGETISILQHVQFIGCSLQKTSGWGKSTIRERQDDRDRARGLDTSSGTGAMTSRRGYDLHCGSRLPVLPAVFRSRVI